ncbi:MAG: GSU2403 family nucleotidyltransferase fold protein [Burkholderiaceae bacterium]
MLELSHNQTRQYIDAVAVFEAWEEATREAQQVRGGMYWHKGPLSNPDAAYLVRTSPAGSETSLGPRSPATEDVYARFQQRKAAAAERLSTLQAKLVEHTRMNRALRVGRLDPLVVSILDRLQVSGLAGYFRVVDTHALYAYEAAAGVRVEDGAVATRDIDLWWDVRQRIRFATQLARVDSSVLGLLQKVDRSFRLRTLQKYTAVNQDGFEVDILRREQQPDDPHPIRLSEDEDDFWVTQARNAHRLMDALPFSAVVVASNGKMARMHTLHPTAFAQFKRWLGGLADRDPLKRRRDVLQADVVEHLVKGYLPPV